MSFNKVLKKYREYSFSERHKGDKFERLMKAYLYTDPKFADKFKKVWLWDEFIAKRDLGGKDTGIDLVALTNEGDYWAIQCKCYDEQTRIDKPAVDSFLATSSRTFKGENLQTTKFSHRLWISTSNNWGSGATEAIKNQHPPVTRLNLFELQEAPVDWEKLDQGIHGKESRTEKFELRDHQKEALNATHEHFKNADRGKLIMACGTGKTFTSLRIAEHETDHKGFVLFLVPSIALLGQTLREWTSQAIHTIDAIAICSDPRVSTERQNDEDRDLTSVVDLALPASTDPQNILQQYRQIQKSKKEGMTVVFSTYQSIEVIAEAQSKIIDSEGEGGVFDLIICDEAHRTTGVALTPEDSSAFIKVHDNDFIKSKKRIYMTATPRLYSEDAKVKAEESEAIICSMDDPEKYGVEMYRIGFGEAVDLNLLTDYKVLILTLNDKDIPPAVQNMISSRDEEIDSDDASKLIGCINALSKQVIGDQGIIKSSDPEPMRRAVAFTSKISASKKITSIFNSTSEVYVDSLPNEKKEEMVSVSSKHIDGTMSAPERDSLLGWLKDSESSKNECRVITNVRCLSEGVDVPSLDSVMFLSARNSQVDVVQSVGRVMRRSPGKKYGYIIIPVVVPSNLDAGKALDDNKRFKVVWSVLNALRAHDDRFNATINKIDLNKKKPSNILIGGAETTFEDGKPKLKSENEAGSKLDSQFALQFEQLQGIMYARMVEKVGNKRYWEQWAQSVGEIAQKQYDRITRLISEGEKHKEAFKHFMEGLHKNINPSLSENEAVEMLSQHIITKPVFDALFEGYSFVENNAMSQSMQKMLDLLEEEAIEKDTVALEKFYSSVRMRAEGIDNAEGKQQIILELYDKFFKTAFPKLVEKLGIVYTPVEVVDFIIHSVNDVLESEFESTLGNKNVHILDPFTGTGTFITRLIQSGLISKKQMPNKYKSEIHANEIVLLAYYIAAVNIENAFHDVMDIDDFESFDGICLTDTFQLGEEDRSQQVFSNMFPKNSKRVEEQMNTPIKVIIGNPPYSRGQTSANDNAQNQIYPKLEEKIENTYAVGNDSTLSRNLYNSYIKAFRWASDRISNNEGGIIAFVTGSGWIDKGGYAGFRKSLEKEFSSIYVINLRGDIRGKSRKKAKQEGQNVFEIMTGVSITILVSKPNSTKKASIKYYTLKDYLNRNDKLTFLRENKSIGLLPLKSIDPNESSDWINKRNEGFNEFLRLDPIKDFDNKTKSIFKLTGVGAASSRDVWVYNFSKQRLAQNMNSMIETYNQQMEVYKSRKNEKIENVVDLSPDKINWSRGLRKDAEKSISYTFKHHKIILGLYRPFTKLPFYYHKPFIESPGKGNLAFPNSNTENLVITIPGKGNRKNFSVLLSDKLPDYNMYDGGCKFFPLYYYEKQKKQNPSIFDVEGGSEYVRKDCISDFILHNAKKLYGNRVIKEDIFYYVYGILHNKEYRSTYENDLRKLLPRIPLVDKPKDFWAFSKAGRELAELHINYDDVPPYKGVNIKGIDSNGTHFKVQKMKFPKKDQKGTIIYNSKIRIENIPDKAYEYIVNGKSAIEWIMDRYRVKTDKKSGIVNDPNDWAEEHDKPTYILTLLLSVINVSIQTVDIVNSLPKIDFENL